MFTLLGRFGILEYKCYYGNDPSTQCGYPDNKITSKEEAEKNFLDLFDVDISGYLTFNNYVAKNPIVDPLQKPGVCVPPIN